ncbi:hypothetical protein [Thalassobaculum sp.]|uniref:hypothetical protein n=1 Tax=Thalassobaculum sp. TaxID=2022740 RepID=UPI0032EE3198
MTAWIARLLKLLGFVALVLLGGTAVFAAVEWKPVTAADTPVRLEHEIVASDAATFARMRTRNYSADRHLAVYATDDYHPHRAVIVYDALLPGYKYEVTTEPEAMIRQLKRIKAVSPEFGEQSDLVSRNRRFTIRRFSFAHAGCFAFVRYWGMAQHELTGEGNRRVQGYVCGRRGAGLTTDSLRAILDGLVVD